MEYTLGDQSWVELRKPPRQAERMEFLRGLDYSLPLHLLCSDCVIFHRRLRGEGETLESYIIWKFGGKDCATNKSYVGQYTCVELPWWLVHLVMRSHRLTPDHGISPEALSIERIVGERGHTSKALITEGRLLFRARLVQSVLPGLRTVRDLSKGLHHILPVCVHSNYKKEWLSEACVEAIRNIPHDKKKRALHKYRSPLYRCTKCPSECSFELKPAGQYSESATRFFDKRQHALVVSLWIDVGEGRSAESGEWRALTGRTKAPFDYGSLESIRTRFERELGYDYSQDELAPIPVFSSDDFRG